jgi:DNA-binding GntR family transcriptional regulator
MQLKPMKDFEPLMIPHVRLVDEASRAIREVILTGELPPGSQLRQADLAQKMRISRTPLREALMKLEQEGLIAVLPRRGFRVVELKLEEAIELYELREMLDGLAARLAAERAANDVLEVLAALINKMEKCVRQHDTHGWLIHHGAFHEEIFKASRNSRLMGLMANIRLSIQRFHPLLLSTQDRLKKAFREHDEIFGAIRSRDPNTAERLARRHIASARDIIIKLSQDEARNESPATEHNSKSSGSMHGRRKRH